MWVPWVLATNLRELARILKRFATIREIRGDRALRIGGTGMSFVLGLSLGLIMFFVRTRIRMVSNKVERTILCKIRYTLFLALQFLNKSIFETEIKRILCDFIILGLR